MKREVRDLAGQLRKQGWSIRHIANELGVSKGSVSAWVREIELTEEQKLQLTANQKHWAAQNKGAESNRIKHKELRQKYQLQGRLKAKQQRPLHLIGCMLYWAEGAKVKKNSVHFVNSDPAMVAIFMRFLREELEVDEAKLALQIHCHSNSEEEIKRIENYWLKLLELPITCLQKTQMKVGSSTRKNRLENGVCALVVHSTEIVQHIYGAIQEYAGFENLAWLF